MKNIIIFISMIFISIFCLHIYLFEDFIMKIGEQEAANLCNELHNLDITNSFYREVYYDKLLYIIETLS